jgi:hypothetical protein
MSAYQSEKILVRLLAVGTFLVTVAVLTSGVTDPVNVTKLFLLGGQSGAVFFLLLFQFRVKVLQESKLLLGALSLFLISGLFASLSSSAPFSQNFYGVTGRNTGLLTYFLLSILLLSASILNSTHAYRTIVFSLLSAGAVNVAYCGWVILFGDFIEWNNPYGNILGTFGNPNFIGSFLGMVFAVLLTWALNPATKVRDRVILLLAMGLTAFEIQDSSAVQGKVVAIGCAAIAIFYWLRSKPQIRVIQVPYVLTVCVLGSFAIAGALQKGPLAELIYKTSVSLRGEYWAAGMRMGFENPVSGVGLDTYGDWYRRFRDQQALILPGPNTVTNAAHNVIIDFFASGGIPLVVTYIFLLTMATRAIIKISLRNHHFDPVFVSLVVAWAGYQVQSVISINQIGLAVWGWILTGALIGYEKVTQNNLDPSSRVTNSSKPRKNRPNEMRPQSVFSPTLLAGLGLVGGFLASVPPLSSDMAWTKAVRSQNFAEVESALKPGYLTPLNSNKLAQITQMLEQSKLYDQAHSYALKGTRFNPDYFEGWKFLYYSSNATEDEKELALNNMRRLDPLNKNLLD